jgi:hypothetical protein
LPGGFFTVRYRLRLSVDYKALTTADPIRPVQNHHKSLSLMGEASDKGTNEKTKTTFRTAQCLLL